MKELQSIHSNNIRIAKKLEELGFYKEADRVDNVNLIVSQKIVLAKLPPIEIPRMDWVEFDDMPAIKSMTAKEILNRSIDSTGKNTLNIKAFVDGLGKAYQKVTGKEVNLSKFVPTLQKFNVALGKIFGYGAIFFSVYSFFVRLSSDQSGAYGDAPKEVAEIVSNLAGVVSGFSMVAAAGGGGGWAVAIAGIAALIQTAISLYLQLNPDGLEDEFDYGRNNYPGRGPKELIEDAYDKLYPNQSYNKGKGNLTDAQKTQLQDKIGEIAKAQNIKGKVVQEAFLLIAQNSRQAPMKKEDTGRLYDLAKKPETKPSGLNPYYGYGFSR